MFKTMLVTMADEGGVAFKDFKIDFQSDLNVFIGTNGSGKSFIYKLIWFNGYMLQIYQILLLLKIPDIDRVFAEQINKWFPLTFTDHVGLSGWVTLEGEDNFNINIEVAEGKLKTFWVDIPEPEKFCVSKLRDVQYNSKAARTFESYETYLKLAKMFDDGQDDDTFFEKMGEFYRLYDIVWFEKVRQKISQYNTDGIPEGNKEMISGPIMDSGPEVDDFDFDFNEEIPSVIYSDGRRMKFTKLSSGLQSMIMMYAFI